MGCNATAVNATLQVICQARSTTSVTSGTSLLRGDPGTQSGPPFLKVQHVSRVCASRARHSRLELQPTNALDNSGAERERRRILGLQALQMHAHTSTGPESYGQDRFRVVSSQDLRTATTTPTNLSTLIKAADEARRMFFCATVRSAMDQSSIQPGDVVATTAGHQVRNTDAGSK